MTIQIQRLFARAGATMGVMRVDGRPAAFTLEDPVRDAKIAGDTAIPVGSYRCRPREAGGIYSTYSRRWAWHRGVIHLQDVPNYTWVYVHAGNAPKDTRGCVLVGQGCDVAAGRISKSRAAYGELYRLVVGSLYDGSLTVDIAAA